MRSIASESRQSVSLSPGTHHNTSANWAVDNRFANDSCDLGDVLHLRRHFILASSCDKANGKLSKSHRYVLGNNSARANASSRPRCYQLIAVEPTQPLLAATGTLYPAGWVRSKAAAARTTSSSRRMRLRPHSSLPVSCSNSMDYG